MPALLPLPWRPTGETDRSAGLEWTGASSMSAPGSEQRQRVTGETETGRLVVNLYIYMWCVSLYNVVRTIDLDLIQVQVKSYKWFLQCDLEYVCLGRSVSLSQSKGPSEVLSHRCWSRSWLAYRYQEVNTCRGDWCICFRPGSGVDLADVVLVRVVFWGHQQQDESLGELDPIQWHHTHVKEDPKQYRQRDLAQNLPNHDGQTWEGGRDLIRTSNTNSKSIQRGLNHGKMDMAAETWKLFASHLSGFFTSN